MFRRQFYVVSALLVTAIIVTSFWWRPVLWSFLVVGPLVVMGLSDALQRRQAVRRNWPLIGRFRYMLEAVRPEIHQYFIEGDTDGKPFGRDHRSVVYQRAKGALATTPFGTQQDVYLAGYEWMPHSIAPCSPPAEPPRVQIGGPDCTAPYSSSYLNISAMSYGSLSRNAIEALNRGAKQGGFAHNTGEGAVSPYHRAGGGDLIYQVGTGYFGCRTKDGAFDPGAFRELMADPQVKMMELKLSQGAKPGHGGILPARKVTPEIAKIRGVPMGQDVLSPPAHRAFDSPVSMLTFIAKLRELSGGKPIGIKLCVGDHVEFLAVCKAMCDTGITPDFISVDGGEGGTGAAPLEFSNSVGWPLREGLAFVHQALVGTGLRDKLTVMASGKIITGFHMVRALALGADLCMSARGMMLALGCIQARRCNSNDCPVGVATQRAALVAGLDVEDKTSRVARYHHETVKSFLELVGAAGLTSPTDIRPHHVRRRLDERRTMHYGELFPRVSPGALLTGDAPAGMQALFALADASRFAHPPLCPR
jgi:glutamate synthase domain-containing protein 2